MTFNWTRVILLPLLAIGLETAWVSAWLSLLSLAFGGSSVRPIIGALTVIIVVFLAWATGRLLLFYEVNLVWTRRVMVTLGATVCVAVSKAEQLPQYGWLDSRWIADLVSRVPDGLLTAPFGAMAVAVYLWWRGECLARARHDTDEVQTRFRIGLAALAICLLLLPMLSRAGQLSQAQDELAPKVFIFAVCALLALSLARLETVRQTVVTSDPTVVAFHRQWVVSIFGAILGLWLVAMAAAHVLYFDLGRLLARPLELLGNLVDLILTIIMYPISLLVELIIYLIRLAIGVGQEVQWEGPPRSLKPEELPERAPLPQMPPEIGNALKWGMAFLVAAVVIYLLWWAVARPVWISRRGGADEDRDSVFTWAEFRSEIMNGIRGLTARLARRPASSIFPPLTEGAPVVRSLREMYRWLLQAGAEVEAPRPAPATPFEYEPVAGAALDGLDEVHTLTAAYVQARYGNHPPPETQVSAARSAWERLRQTHERRLSQEDARL